MNRIFALLPMLAVLACARDARRASPVAPPRADLLGFTTVSGPVYGPDAATSICQSLPPGGRFFVRLIQPGPFTFNIVAASSLVRCPADSYRLTAPDGRYYLQVAFYSPLSPLFPTRHLDLTPITLAGTPLTRPITVAQGAPLQGHATLDGLPLAGVPITIDYVLSPDQALTGAVSGADGRWMTDASAPPALQTGVAYHVPRCDALGIFPAQPVPTGAFNFPAESDSVGCALRSAATGPFTHSRTRLVLTAGPGDLGMARAAEPQLSRYGTGYGIQYPVASGQQPLHAPLEASQMFTGGLVIGVKPDIVLSAIDLCGHLPALAPNCRSLGGDAQVVYNRGGPPARQVLWRFSDAGAGNAVGLEVTQQSVDGLAPHDYVLIGFRIRNSSGSALTIYPGLFTDWDTNRNPSVDVGGMGLDGRLLYQHNDPAWFADAPFFGTVLLGDARPAARFFFANNAAGTTQTPAELVSALAGERAGLEPTIAGDWRYLQGVGPITLKGGQSVELWFAVVAGQNLDDLLANANAALADRRRGAAVAP